MIGAHAQALQRSKGYSGSVELFAGTGGNTVYSGWRAFGLQTAHGYRFSPHFSLHLGVGLLTDRFWPMVLPIQVDGRVDFGRTSTRPFLQAGVGYGLPLLVEVGGMNVQFGLGLHAPVSPQLGIIASAAVRFQTHSEEVYGPYMVMSGFVEFRLGLAFGSFKKENP